MEFSKLFPPTLDGTVYVEITHRCNYSCKHCYANCPSNEEMSFEKIKKLSKILKKQGFKKILLTGGEPLLAKHISDTINLLSKDFKVILITNGTLIRDVNVNYKKLSGVFEKVPLAKDTGVNVVSPNWRGFYGAPEMKKEVVKYWEETLGKMVKTKEWKNVLETMAWVDYFQTGEKLWKFLDEELAMYEKLAKELGLAQ